MHPYKEKFFFDQKFQKHVVPIHSEFQSTYRIKIVIRYKKISKKTPLANNDFVYVVVLDKHCLAMLVITHCGIQVELVFLLNVPYFEAQYANSSGP